MKLTHMKVLTFNFRVALSALFCCVALTGTTSAQEEAVSPWVKVAPPNEAFTVMMPRKPVLGEGGGSSGARKVAGYLYSLRHDNTGYMIWSFKAANFPVVLSDDSETYLDQCAEMAWSLLIEPYWQKFKDKSPDELTRYNLTYDGDLPSPGHLGRRYRLELGGQRGMTHIYAVGSQIYIVAAAGASPEFTGVEKFIKSFTLNLPVPKTPVRLPAGVRMIRSDGASGGTTGISVGGSGTGVGGGEGGGMGVGPGTGSGIGPGTAGGIGSGESGGTTVAPRHDGGGGKVEPPPDYTRTFRVGEVTRKAQILAKPEPLYTEWARKFGVTGVVRLRLVLRRTGEVGDITLMTKLPHGLTQKAIEAAKGIRFKRAEKDGRYVSQYVTIEYNFNIY
ncbi:MAG TPA: energy transducer TonB [Pyrinomonadaceae bacterium]|nr:energy transducer TonB [Pyrinomonadaceae bacterium]